MHKYRLLELAEQIATTAHKGQVDKAGIEYINHPKTVASFCQTVDAKIVGWLHDVVEDTNVTFDDLELIGFDDYLIEALKCVTKENNYNEEEYYFRIKNNEIAREVKLADLTHNSDFSRIPSSAPEELKTKMKGKQKKYLIYKAYLLDSLPNEKLYEYIKRMEE